ncbi:hypothetical protein HUF15_45055 [Streptomyces samsunensis]|uniref:hypothetical protein n=1 Tax=Streptomyces malaysiensis TaxID=92644 RepID=UPI0015843B8C|nr:hypothetical protein [Streptomyces samsunensis]NUH43775.1 hypothetical protein [Streptomyces samsunensis]
MIVLVNRSGPNRKRPRPPAIADDPPGHHHSLARRKRRTGELAFRRCCSAAEMPLSTPWCGSPETFQSGKDLAGPDEHQVRPWTSWHRWVVLAVLSHAFPLLSAPMKAPAVPGRTRSYHSPTTRSSTCSTHASSCSSTKRPTGLDWSAWRRRHQARSQASHYQRQAGEA